MHTSSIYEQREREREREGEREGEGEGGGGGGIYIVGCFCGFQARPSRLHVLDLCNSPVINFVEYT